jgi:PPM family protein phosphatase
MEQTHAASAQTLIPHFGHVRVAGMTDRGRVREANEDHFVVAGLTSALQIEATSLPQPALLFGGLRVRGHLFIVADGMGGHAGGQEASAIALWTIEDFLVNTLRWFFRLQGSEGVLSEFQNALRVADQRIFAAAADRPDLHGMGTTVTMAYAVDHTLYVAHVGDSRLYVLRGGQLYQVTNDHTVTAELLRRHIIDAEHAATHPMRNIVTNSVGGDEPGVRPEVHRIPLERGDAMLLCTDGLTDMVPPEELTRIVGGEDEPDAACRALIERANALGGADNITAIVARFD